MLDLALARSAWKSMVAVRLMSPSAHLEWSRTPLPAITNLDAVRDASVFAGVDKSRLFLNDTAPTALERANGNWGPAVRRLCDAGASPSATVASLSAAFDQHLASASRQPRTRADYWRAWRLVVTWAVARKAVDLILPMSIDTLKALTWDMVCFAVPSSQIEMVWRSIQARHRQFQLRQPFFEPNQYSLWIKMLGSVRGCPLNLKYPIQKHTVRWLLAWRPTTLAAHRARLLTVVATLACLRVNEVALLQVCDLWFDHLTGYGVPGFDGTCSLHIIRGRTTRSGKDTGLRSAAREIRISTSCGSYGCGFGSRGWRCARTARSVCVLRHVALVPPCSRSRVAGQGGSRWSRTDRAPVSRRAT